MSKDWDRKKSSNGSCSEDCDKEVQLFQVKDCLARFSQSTEDVVKTETERSSTF